jgi:probable rRNA maturation factor
MMPVPTTTTQDETALEVVIDAAIWSDQLEAEETVRRAIAAAGKRGGKAGEICVVLTDDAAIRELNRTWRHIDKPTNVLSFPGSSPATGPAPVMLGDIVIAYETVAREAVAEGKPFLDHLAHLSVHGFLHLLGYDHEDGGQAEQMERLERDILATIGVNDPYLAADTET